MLTLWLGRLRVRNQLVDIRADHLRFAADVLRKRLEHQSSYLLPELHRRASQWYEQNGFIPEAIHHSLTADDQDRAIQLTEQNGCLLLIRGEVSNLPNWIKAVEPRAQTCPWMYILKAWLFALTGCPERVEEMEMLGATSRTQAISLGRDLRLFE